LHRIEKKLVTDHNCTDDPEQPEVILYQATQAPSRIAYATGQSSQSFAPYFINAAKFLKQAGATLCCIPCNTAHCVIDEIEREAEVPFINLIDETLRYIVSEHATVKNVGILGSAGTVKSKLHDLSLQKLDLRLNFIYPSNELQNEIGNGICAVKSGIMYKNPNIGQEFFTAPMNELIDNGADLIVLGCTEIPLAITADAYRNIPLADTIAILADACIARCHA
jgi:aspartate racemase